MRKRFPLTAAKVDELYERMERSSVYEKDLEETYIQCSGRGGQKVNKTSAGVFLRHGPTGAEVKCTSERSQGLNRFFARRMLLDKLERMAEGGLSELAVEAARIRKQKQRRRARGKKKENVSPSPRDGGEN